MKKVFLIFGILIAVTVSTCDKIKNPYVISNNSAAGCPVPVFPVQTSVKKVLVEDYTAHRCTNCPSAAITLENIEANPTYGQQVIGLEVHAGQLASPSPCYPPPGSLPSNAFEHYLGCLAGENYFSAFAIQGNPSGMIDRVPVSPGSPAIAGASGWDTWAASEASKSPVADINIVTNYDSTSRKLCLACKTTFLTSMTGIYNLSVLFVEDSIFDWQDSSGTFVSNYLFRNVLRDDINGNGTGFGVQIASGVIAVNDTVVKSYSYPVPAGYAFKQSPITAFGGCGNFLPLSASLCNYKHCYVLAFIYDNTGGSYSSNPNYREILQAEIKKIAP